MIFTEELECNNYNEEHYSFKKWYIAQNTFLYCHLIYSYSGIFIIDWSLLINFFINMNGLLLYLWIFCFFFPCKLQCHTIMTLSYVFDNWTINIMSWTVMSKMPSSLTVWYLKSMGDCCTCLSCYPINSLLY